MSIFSQIYIQLVFAVKGRQSLIHPSWETELHKYISGIVTKKGQKLITINGVKDHIHIFIGLKPSCKISDLVREIKKSSNAFINEKGFINRKFEWQEGYGAFSYSQSSIENVFRYINNQKEHHKKNTFRDEYLSFLNEYKINYKKEYLFEFL